MGEESMYNSISKMIIGAAIEVHKEMEPGLMESVYESCLLYELKRRGLDAECQVKLPVIYKGKTLERTFRIDLLVEDKIVVELKAVDDLREVHEVQLVTYLKLSGKKLGLLINFNVPILTKGIKRKLNGILQ